ncbi:hypothetical protein CHS0354_010666, partial [Potamilus streckersoni]
MIRPLSSIFIVFWDIRRLLRVVKQILFHSTRTEDMCGRWAIQHDVDETITPYAPHMLELESTLAR